MRIANLAGRLVLLSPDSSRALDVERASAGRFPADPQAVYDVWAEFTAWAASADPARGVAFDPADLGAPAPRPRQVLAVGLNFGAHAAEAGLAVPERPVVFTKFPTCITGPYGDVVLPDGGDTDWEAELVAVIGRRAERVTAELAWAHVAGLTAGQDLSERIVQMAGPSPQFNLGKSFPGFGPTGPWLVTPDAFADPDDLAITCDVDGERVQHGRTRDMIFSLPRLIAELSAILPLLPGDLIFAGTPSGIGAGLTPPRFLRPGAEVVTRIEGIGEMRHRMVAAPAPAGV
ncbi:fumarylacetoacetate hydrolase family protein [Actinocorallia sp. A-T 12471]|uniref:fumarylacetoacetate hydrolase family protein n=1 Tax=Actinocorallia sp. A-T 12471 TaxID=3089813 RepID=UPI0029CD46C5|nr:fumarylacetoacetate hydrolase family protein [Actinocorallia sp. A-T 12471]MDX6740041.1 fumarylacetoacetate hydrolase family protein [Actinocorallia sp. A-T 12471]